mmetsp:Transcript_13172/g.34321  ORF Transcript_13172/g.34321 Transcript_13172/m.34321 type:complete len:259 (+) Transcript_13172:399-1175(+)
MSCGAACRGAWARSRSVCPRVWSAKQPRHSCACVTPSFLARPTTRRVRAARAPCALRCTASCSTQRPRQRWARSPRCTLRRASSSHPSSCLAAQPRSSPPRMCAARSPRRPGVRAGTARGGTSCACTPPHHHHSRHPQWQARTAVRLARRASCAKTWCPPRTTCSATTTAPSGWRGRWHASCCQLHGARTRCRRSACSSRRTGRYARCSAGRTRPRGSSGCYTPRRPPPSRASSLCRTFSCPRPAHLSLSSSHARTQR